MPLAAAADSRFPVTSPAQSSDSNSSNGCKFDAAFDCSISMSSVSKPGPHLPGRSRRKPRLTKMRKQSGLNLKDSKFNPVSERVSEGTCSSSGCCGTGSINLFPNSCTDGKFVELNSTLNQGNNESFVNVETNKSDCAVKLGTNLNKENGKGGNDGLAFGVGKNYSGLNLENLSFSFGANEFSSSKFILKSKNGVGTGKNSFESHLNMSNDEPSSSESNSNAKLSSEFGRRRSSSNDGQPQDDKVKNFDYATSSFVVNEFESTSDSKLEQNSSHKSEQSGMFHFGKVTGRSSLHSDRLRANFVFGASRPTADFGNIGNGECNTDEADRVLESQGPKLNAPFVFGCGVKGKNQANENGKAAKDLEDFDREKTQNHSGFLSGQNNLSTDGRLKFASSFTNVEDTDLPRNPIFKLSDEMNSLNIGHSAPDNGSKKTINLNEKSHVNIQNVFVFGSNQNILNVSTESSAYNSCDQPENVNVKDPCSNCAADKDTATDDRPNAKKSRAPEVDGSFACSLKGDNDKKLPGDVAYTNAKSGLSSEQIHSFSFSAGTSGKENQPINYGGTTGGQSDSLQNNLNSDIVRDKMPFPVISPEGFGSQHEDHGPEILFGHQAEKDFSFPRTPFVLGKSFSEFDASNSNKSFSFTANLFAGVAEKLDTGVSSRLRDKKVKKKKSLKQRMSVQRVAGEADLSGESSSKHNKDSPGCCSPMEFSPYRYTNTPTSADNCTGATETKEEGVGSKEAPLFKDSAKTYEEGNEKLSGSDSGQDSDGQRDFSSYTSPSAQDGLSSIRRQYRKKYKLKVDRGSDNINDRKVEFSSDRVQYSSFDRNRAAGVQNVVRSHIRNKDIHASKVDEDHGKLDLSDREACEQWRMRGNQAYKSGNLSQAEDFYTKGIKTVSAGEISSSCIEPLLLCYSNRAATRMSLRRMREAISDCVSAAALDPHFLKVKLRAANCYLVLGEVEEAIEYYNNCLGSNINLCLDRRITIEAADGLQKAQKVSEHVHQCAELLQQRTAVAAKNALGITAEALSISCYSENLLELKGEALCMLQMYNEVVKLCESTLDIAEKNSTSDIANPDDFNCKSSPSRLWRWHLMSRSYFHLGKLEVALDLIEKQEQVISVGKRSGSITGESSSPLAATIRELLHRKKSGNDAFKSGKYPEAIDHYTAAISSSVESRPFAAICFCNRAAAHQALGQLVDAIADCSVAIALDKKYTKAVSRRATLHEMIRDYGHAVNDLERLISLQESQSQERTTQSEVQDKSNGSSAKEAKRIRRQLSSIREKAKRETSLDLYLILGVKSSDTESDIKKAYRKAALRHHPDKAGQILSRSDAVDDGGLWKEISETVRDDADRLFKLIGEAYAVLSDSNKRSKYDLEEELKDIDRDSKSDSDYRRQSDSYCSPSGRTNSSRRQANFYSSPFGSSSSSGPFGQEYWSSRRYTQEYWRTYGESNSRW